MRGWRAIEIVDHCACEEAMANVVASHEDASLVDHDLVSKIGHVFDEILLPCEWSTTFPVPQDERFSNAIRAVLKACCLFDVARRIAPADCWEVD